MTDHRITLDWQRNDATFERGNYPKDHRVRYLGGQTLGVSAAAAYGGNATLADPEQVLLSALSSCHLLTFLAVAANRGYIVDEYLDDAECELGKNAEGVTAVVGATLRPSVRSRLARSGWPRMLYATARACRIWPRKSGAS